jgi:lysophospholipid acyltransferase 5
MEEGCKFHCVVILISGYYMTGTETYDIKWSMPQCVLTLRLIGLAFDLFDGKKLEVSSVCLFTFF